MATRALPAPAGERGEESRAEQRRAEQRRAEESRGEQSRAEGVRSHRMATRVSPAPAAGVGGALAAVRAALPLTCYKSQPSTQGRYVWVVLSSHHLLKCDRVKRCALRSNVCTLAVKPGYNLAAHHPSADFSWRCVLGAGAQRSRGRTHIQLVLP